MQAFLNFLYTIFAYFFRFLFSFVGNYGIALVIFAVFFRVILLPSSIKQQKSMAKMARIQPKLKRIREKYQDYSPQERNMKIQQETTELYQQEGYSSMGASCLPLLLQMPVLMGIYGVVQRPLTLVLQFSEAAMEAFKAAAADIIDLAGRTGYYAESMIISNIEAIVKKSPELLKNFPDEIEAIRNFDFTVFGIDLGAIPKTVYAQSGISLQTIAVLAIPVLAGLASFLPSFISQRRQKKNNPGGMENQQMMGCMMFMMPAWSVFLAWGFPAGMGMYWILSSVIAFVQTLVLGYFYSPKKMVAKQMVEETIYRRSYEENKKVVRMQSADNED